MDRIVLTVDGIEYREWTSVEVRRSLEDASASFSLSVSERAARLGPPMSIRPGSACVVSVDDGSLSLPAVTGYVDDQETSTTTSSHETTVTGRSKTADIIDCQVVTPRTLNRQTLLGIAEALCVDYGVEATESPAGCSGAAFEAWKVEPDETAFESIERAARLRKVLLTDDAEGRLVIRQISDDGAPVAELTMPGNVEQATVRLSSANLYTDYEVYGQHDGRDLPTYTGAVASVRGVAQDGTLTRYRLRRVMAEAQQTPASALDRARWEAATRAGRASLYTCTVGSWRIAEGGDLWAPGMMVHVADTYQGVDADLLLVDVTLRYGDDGTHADLSLAPVCGYLPESPAEYEQRKTATRGAKKAKPQAGLWPELATVTP